MKTLHISNAFKRQVKKLQKRNKDLTKLQGLIDLLRLDQDLPHNARPHKLSGEWSGVWECHIEGDWLLVYDFDETALSLIATGTHQDLFKKY